MIIILILQGVYGNLRDEQPINNNGAFINLAAKNSSSFKYKSNLIGDLVAYGANSKK